MVTSNKILVSVMKTHIHSAIIVIHIHVADFNRKMFWTNKELGGAATVTRCGKQMGILGANPEGHRTSDGKSGDTSVPTVCDGPVMRIYVRNKFRKVEGKLPVRFNRTYVVGSHIIFFVGAAVIAIGFHNNHLMAGYKICDVVSAVFIAFVKVAIRVTASKIPLRPAMEKINDWISFCGICGITRRKKYPIISDFSKYVAVMPGIDDCYRVRIRCADRVEGQ